MMNCCLKLDLDASSGWGSGAPVVEMTSNNVGLYQRAVGRGEEWEGMQAVNNANNMRLFSILLFF